MIVKALLCLPAPDLAYRLVRQKAPVARQSERDYAGGVFRGVFKP